MPTPLEQRCSKILLLNAYQGIQDDKSFGFSSEVEFSKCLFIYEDAKIVSDSLEYETIGPSQNCATYGSSSNMSNGGITKHIDDTEHLEQTTISQATSPDRRRSLDDSFPLIVFING
ncbi:hypothetical protein C5167_034428, partial [Papaver somniferum]